MLPFKNLILIDKKNMFPAYKQINNKLILLIQEGKIQPGVYLPGTRQLALELQVNRKTIIRAYEELIAQGWLEAFPKKGYRIPEDLPIIKPRSFATCNIDPVRIKNKTVIDNKSSNLTFLPDYRSIKFKDIVVSDGFPDVRLLPLNGLFRNYRKQFNTKSTMQLMGLRDDGGIPQLKEGISSFLNQTRGLNISIDNLTITRGAQMAIYIAATLLLKSGDEVIISEPNYPFANEIFKHIGAKLNLVPVNAEGLDIDYLEELLIKTSVKLLYIVPHHHHPTTVTMSASRRLRLLQLIKKYKFWVIEDDYDYDFHFKNSPILPLASSDHDGKIIYIGSFTKLLAPSFRVGYMVADTAFIAESIRLRRLIDLRGDTVMELSLAEMISNGDLIRHIKKSNKLYASRCEYICKLLSEKLGNFIRFEKPSGGMAIWIKFNVNVDLPSLIKKVALSGIYLTGCTYYKEGSPHHNGLRFGFAALDEMEMHKAVNAIAACLE